MIYLALAVLFLNGYHRPTISPRLAGTTFIERGTAPVRGVACEQMTQQYLQEAFIYNAATGVLTWQKDRPMAHFKNELGRNIWRSMCAGKVAGSNSDGYILLWVGGKYMKAHRVVWIMMRGEIPPKMQIDHINGIKADNRIDNLRLATNRENGRNSHSIITNTSGVRGVSWFKRDGKWRAQISIDGRRKHLGYFDTINDAAEAYRAASLQHYGVFSPFNRTTLSE